MADNPILFLGSNKLRNAELIEAFHKGGANPLLYCSSLREANRHLTENHASAAFIPAGRNDSQIYSLRMLQPDLPVILITERPDQPVRERQRQAAVAVISQDELLSLLPSGGLLEKPANISEPQSKTVRTAEIARAQTYFPTPDQFKEIAQGLLNHPIIRFVIMQLPSHKPLGYHRTYNQEVIQQAVNRLPGQVDSRNTQIRFLEITNAQGLFETTMLYTRPHQDGLLTIGVDPSATVSDVRVLINRVIAELNAGREIGDILPPLLNTPAVRARYAIVLRAQRPLTEPECIILNDALPHIARKNRFSIYHTDIPVGRAYAHLLADLPPQRNTAWVVQQLKRGSADLLHIEGDRSTIALWREGFFAKRSMEPLTDNELSHVLT